jgi:hypothetical protein
MRRERQIPWLVNAVKGRKLADSLRRRAWGADFARRRQMIADQLRRI